MADIKQIGNRIKERRAELNLTLQDVAEYVGVTKSTIQRYETNKIISPKLPVIQEISRCLTVNPLWLIGKSDVKDSFPSSGPNNAPIMIQRVPMLLPTQVDEGGQVSVDASDCVEYGAVSDVDFCLRVNDDSMNGMRIYSGDIVFICKQDDVEDGEIAAVLIGKGTVLKRVYKLEDRLQLRSENPSYPPITVSKEERGLIRILGKAVAFQSQIK